MLALSVRQNVEKGVPDGLHLMKENCYKVSANGVLNKQRLLTKCRGVHCAPVPNYILPIT